MSGRTSLKLDPRQLASILVAMALMLPVLGLAAYVYMRHQWAEEQLAELEPRYARLTGLEQKREQLEQSVAQASAIVDLYAYPEAQDATQAGNDAQRRIRDVFSKAGLEVVSSQVLASKQEKQFDKIPITVRFEGELAALQAAMVALGGLPQPAIMVDGFNIQTIGAVKAEVAQRLGGQFNLYVLRVHP